MLFKQMLVCGTRHIQFVSPNTMRRKCASLSILKFELCFQENKINFINSKFCSSYEGPPKNQSHNTWDKFNSEEKIKLKKWIDMIKYEGGRVPQYISEVQYSELLKLEGEIPRLKYLHFLTSKESSKMKDKARKERMQQLKREKKEKERSNNLKGHIEYGLWKNTMFAKTTKHHANNLRDSRLSSAMLHNQPLVIDLGFYDYMENREVSSLATQILLAIKKNRFNAEPFNLTLCNVDFDSQKFRQIYKIMPNLGKPKFPINITSDNYLDIFPKEKLVYLTPDARDEMKEFDHEAIYIIGGIVNLRGNDRITYSKANKDNIKMMKLPINKYHISKSNHRELDLAVHVMVHIMLELQTHGDFKKAFKNIPRRLLFTGDESHSEIYHKPTRF